MSLDHDTNNLIVDRSCFRAFSAYFEHDLWTKTLVLRPVATEVGCGLELGAIQQSDMGSSVDGREMALSTAILGKCETQLSPMFGYLAVARK